MPQVPGLIPEVNPQTAGTPNVSVDAPVAAFGGTVGLAMEKLGGELGRSSDVIWQRAVQLQEQQNKTEHDFAEAEYIKQSAAENAKFSTLEGVNAGPKALEQHINNLEDIRRTIGSSLSNGRTQQMFAATSNDTTARYVVNATNHSVAQGHAAYTKGLTLKQGTIGKELADTYDPDRPELTKDLEDRFEASSRLLAQNSGLSTKVDKDTGLSPAEMYARSAKTTIALEIAARLSQTDPDKAQKYIETQHEAKVLQGPDYDKAQNAFRSVAYPVIASGIVKGIWDDGYKDNDQTLTLAEAQKKVAAAAEERMPGDKQFATRATAAMNAEFRQRRAEQIDQQNRDTQTLNELMLQGRKSLPLMLAVPEGRAAYDRLPAKLQEQYSKADEKAVASADYDAQKKKVAYLKGMSYSEDPRIQQQFMDLPLQNMGIDQANLTELMQRRAAIIKGEGAAAPVQWAVRVIKNSPLNARLQALHISKESDNPTRYHEFIGHLETMLDVWKDKDGKPPTADTILNTIGPMLLQRTVENAYPFGIGDKEYTYKLGATPQDVKAALTARAKALGQPLPTDSDVRRAYLVRQLRMMQSDKTAP